MYDSDDLVIELSELVKIHRLEADSDWGFTAFTLKEAFSYKGCLLYTSPSPRDRTRSRMPSSA